MLKAQDLAKTLKVADDKLPPVVLVFGDDNGQVRELTKQALGRLCEDINDPFAITRLDVSELIQEPSALYDSASTVSLMGGARLVWVEGVGGHLDKTAKDTLAKAVETYLQDPPAAAMVVIGAYDLPKDHRLVKVVDKHKQAAAVRCFQEQARDMQARLGEFCSQEQKTLDAEARRFLLDSLGNDRAVTESELTKLALYTKGQENITLEDCLQSVAAAPSINVFKLCDAVGLRRTVEADGYLQALRHEGEDLNGITMMVFRHLSRLRDWQRLCDSGLSGEEACGKIRPPVPPFGRRAFIAQAQSYPKPRLANLTEKSRDVLLQARQNYQSADLILSRAILAYAV